MATGGSGAWYFRLAERDVHGRVRAQPSNDGQLNVESEETNPYSWASTGHRGQRKLTANSNAVLAIPPRIAKTNILAEWWTR